ncbi:MAG: xanthine dehydrogenase family protein molybdopterin-binding subunit [Nitrososphaeria archaeon]
MKAETVEEFISELQRKAEKGELLYIGQDLKRLDDLEKVLGSPVYTNDLLPRNALYARLVLSKYPHALIKGISVSKALNYLGVRYVLTYKDVPGLNESSAIIPDRPLFAYNKVRSTGDIVAAVIAEKPTRAKEATELVEVDYEQLPAVFDPLEAMKPDAPKIHEGGNIIKHVKVRKGDIERGFQEADYIIENTFRTQHQDAVALETETAFAVPKDGKVLIIGSMQTPHHVQAAVAKVLGWPIDRVEVIQAVTGGAFGPKSDETPYDVASIAALGALKTGRPVLMSMTREESMKAHTKRHPAIITHKTGVKSNGKLTASKVQIVLDGGAYASLGVLVIVRATFHANGPYDIPNVWNDGYKVYTNNTYTGSFRGFGAPQAIFAAEAQMDEIARKLNMDPLDLRLINMLRPGSRTSTGQLMDESCGLPECVEAVVNASNYRNKRKKYESQTGTLRRGIGIALLHHGNALGPEGNDYAYVHLSVERSGKIHLGTGLTEYGTGAISGLAQIAASVLGVPLDYFVIDRPNTLVHHETGPTVASRVTAIGGNAARDAALKLRQKILPVASKMLECNVDDVVLVEGYAFCRGKEAKKVAWEEIVKEAYDANIELSTLGYYIAPECKWDPETGLGSPYNQYTFGAAIAEVEVDTETGQYRVLNYYVAFDVGKAINPQRVRGQILGGTVQGLGYAMMEELVHKNGYIVNPSLKDYYIPTSLDIPENIQTFIIEKAGSIGPYGAKIVAEPPIVLPAPAVRNAILNAVGNGVNSLPITPEKVLNVIKSSRS